MLSRKYPLPFFSGICYTVLYFINEHSHTVKDCIMDNNSSQNGFSGNQNNGGKEDNTLFHVGSWILTIILLSTAWPLGLVMLFLNLSGKIDKFHPRRLFGSSGTNASRAQTTRRASSGVTYQPGTSSVRRTDAASASQPSAQTASSTGAAARSGKKGSSFAKVADILLLILGVVLILVGGSIVGEELRYVQYGLIWSEVIKGIFYIIGGAGSLVARFLTRRRTARFNRLNTIVNTNVKEGRISVKDIAKSSGLDLKTTRKELTSMIEKGFFGDSAYIDSEIDCLILTREAADKIRSFAQEAKRKAEEELKRQREDTSDGKYASILAELKRLDADIVDQSISDKIVRIEELSEKIFKIVDENPEKAPQIRKFMDYYLPTTLKLLRSYSVLERQGISGQNISAAKADIDRILDTLIKGYEQQLDLLFQEDAIDISSDIEVLETMLRNDGLKSDDSGFGTTAGGV